MEIPDKLTEDLTAGASRLRHTRVELRPATCDKIVNEAAKKFPVEKKDIYRKLMELYTKKKY